MLEESAAQLAALRQRAEYLLDQLSAGSQAAPARANENVRSEDQATTSDDHTPADPGNLPNSDLEPKGLPPFVPLQDENTAPRAYNSSPGETEPSDQESDPPATTQSVSYQDDRHPPDSPYHTNNFSQPDQALDPPTEAFASSEQPAPNSVAPAETQQQAYPLQNFAEATIFPSGFTDNHRAAKSLAPAGNLARWNANRCPTDRGRNSQPLRGHRPRARNPARKHRPRPFTAARSREIISAEPQRIERAHYNIEQAKQIIDRAKFSRNRSRGIAVRTFGLLILWLGRVGRTCRRPVSLSTHRKRLHRDSLLKHGMEHLPLLSNSLGGSNRRNRRMLGHNFVPG